MVTQTDIAWVAGVIDALGLIKIRELENGTKLPAVYVSTAKFEITERLAEMTDVGVTTVKRDYKRLGCGAHCNEPHLHVKSRTARWHLTGMKATVVLNACLPYMRVQTADAEQAVEIGKQAPAKPATAKKLYDMGWSKLTTVTLAPILDL